MKSFENRSLHDEGFQEDDADLMFANRVCCCFLPSWYRRQPSDSSSSNCWERIHAPSDHSGAGELWGMASTRLRYWSELVGGPRWKNFIRRFNKTPRNLRGSARLGVKFHYDPLSYALNFDESPDRDAGFRDFSSRFAAPPVSAKPLVHLGGSDAVDTVVPAASVALSADSIR